MKIYAIVSGLCAALILNAPVKAAENTQKERSGATGSQKEESQTLSKAEEKFVREAATGGKLEVTLGELAKDKATNPEVKKFGEMMASDHGKANSQLKSLAQKKNIELPDKLDSKDQQIVDKLSKLSGAEFDKAYLDHMVKDHRKDINEFERQSKSGEDPELKSWAEKTLPTLREHYEKVRALEESAAGKKSM